MSKTKSKKQSTIERRVAFDFKPAKTVKAHREGTKRAELIKLLRKGATFEKCMEVTGWNQATCHEGIKLLHTYCGYGIKESSTGRIQIYT